jgi:hypothetical protein
MQSRRVLTPGVLLVALYLTPLLAAAAPFDAGHVIISAINPVEALPQYREIDLGPLLVEDGIHLGPVHAAGDDLGRECIAPPCGLFADGPFWDVHVQAKPGFVLRSVSVTGSVVGDGILDINFPFPIFSLSPPPAVAFFAPDSTETAFSIAGGYFIGPEEPVAAYDVIVRFATVSAVGEPGIAALVAGAALTIMAIARRRE